MSDLGSESTAPAPAKRGYLGPGIIALVVIGGLALLFGVVGLTSHTPDSLSGPAVALLLESDLEVHGNPPDIHCPTNEPIRAGLVFDCTLLRSGRSSERIRVTETGHADFSYRPPTPG